MNLAEYAADNNLHRVGARPSLPAYMAEVWRRRTFILSLAKFRIEAKNQRARLGMGWVVVAPLLNAVVYGVVFGILQGSRRPENFLEFLIVGLFIYQFVAATLNAGAKSITGNTSLVQSLSFPRMVLPIATTVQELLNFGPMVVVMIGIVLLSGSDPSVEWLLFLPLVVIVAVFNAGVAMFTARLTVHFRDLDQLLPFLTRFLFYTSGIFFAVDKIFQDYPLVVRLYDFQPIHEFLSIGRSIFIDGVSVDPWYWLYATLWSIGIFVVGIFFFWSAEERYGRED